MNLLSWNIDYIKRNPSLNWLYYKKEEWTSLTSSRMKFLLNGCPFLVFCDNDYKWFERYFIYNINRKNNKRPILPFFSLSSIYPNLDLISTSQEIDLLNDMLNIVFKDGFIYFYIGKSSSLSMIAKNKEDSYIWSIDEDIENSFVIDSNDDTSIDIKFLDMFNIFDNSLSAVLFNEVSI